MIFFKTDKTAFQSCWHTAGSESSIDDNTAGETWELRDNIIEGSDPHAMLTVENAAARTYRSKYKKVIKIVS